MWKRKLLNKKYMIQVAHGNLQKNRKKIIWKYYPKLQKASCHSTKLCNRIYRKGRPHDTNIFYYFYFGLCISNLASYKHFYVFITIQLIKGHFWIMISESEFEPAQRSRWTHAQNSTAILGLDTINWNMCLTNLVEWI